MKGSKQTARQKRTVATSVPRGQQVRQHILQKIVTGEWPPGHRVPSEADLKAAFACARMTVHYAVKELRDEGYLERIQGVGTFVAQPHVHVATFRLVDIAHEAALAGQRHSLDVISRVERRATQSEARQFRIPAGAPLFHTTVLHRIDGRPAELERRVVNARAFPEYLQSDFTTRTPFAVLMDRVPYPEGRMTVTAVAPTADERRLLQLPSDQPCLEIDRVTWSHGVVYSHARALLGEPRALTLKIAPPLGRADSPGMPNA